MELSFTIDSTPQVDVTPQQNVEASTSLLPASDTSATSASFRDLHPTPKMKRTQKTNDGRRQTAAVLTSPAFRQALFDKTNEKAAANRAKSSSNDSIGKAKTKTKDKKTQAKTKKIKKTRRNECQNAADAEKDDPSNFCAECGCSYFDRNQNDDEEWIRCQQCERWYHETCADAVNDMYFTCKKCLE
jgi:hypothetical protein